MTESILAKTLSGIPPGRCSHQQERLSSWSNVIDPAAAKTKHSLATTPADAARTEASVLVQQIVRRHIGELVKVSIARTATALGWSSSRTEDIWRREARIIHSWEMDMLRRMTAQSKVPANRGAQI